jgi:hypothetical protein
VRQAATETLLELKLNRGVLDFVRTTLGENRLVELEG